MNSNLFPMILCLVCFVSAVIISYYRKVNTGILSLAFAYLIGCFVLNMKVNEVIALFPVKILFLLFSVCLFYGYAIQNGTLKILSDHVIYRFRSHTKFLPFVLYFLSFGLAALGASAPAISSFMGPICMIIAEATGIHYLIMLLILCIGAGSGSLLPWSQGGLIIRGVIETTNFADSASEITTHICINLFITGLVALIIAYFVLKAYKAKPYEIEKVDKFNTVQKKTLCILVLVISLVLIPTILNTLHPVPALQHFARLFDIQMLSIIGAALCALFKLGDEKKVILSSIPWNTIVLVCGVCVFLGVANTTGFTESLLNLINLASSQKIIAIILIMIGGFLSFFTGALTVVVPMLLPAALTIAEQNGFSGVILASALVIGATTTSMSPFSTGGSFILSCIPDIQKQERMFNVQFLFTCLMFLIPIVLSILNVYSIFS